MKIRCTECSKKIMIDEAFAGGVCRCPYCKAIVFVPTRDGGRGATARPSSPAGRPSAPSFRAEAPSPRPESPMTVEAGAAPPEQPTEEPIPMANRVRVQGIVSIVLLGLVLLMIVGSVWMSYRLFWKDGAAGPGKDANHHVGALKGTTAASAVAAEEWHLTPEAPVLYCIDGSMHPRVFDMAASLLLNCVGKMPPGASLNVLVFSEKDEDDRDMGGLIVNSKENQEKVRKLVQAPPGGAADFARALKKALETKAALKTVVVFSNRDISAVTSQADSLKAKARFTTVALPIQEEIGLQDDTKTSMEDLARKTGGEARSFDTYAKLRDASGGR
jgi:phage FluMu protein Com